MLDSGILCSCADLLQSQSGAAGRVAMLVPGMPCAMQFCSSQISVTHLRKLGESNPIGESAVEYISAYCLLIDYSFSETACRLPVGSMCTPGFLQHSDAFAVVDAQRRRQVLRLSTQPPIIYKMKLVIIYPVCI